LLKLKLRGITRFILFFNLKIFKIRVNICTKKLTVDFVDSHPKHAVTAEFAAGVVRQGHRHLDVLVLRVRLPLADGVRRGQQLHGPARHQGNEGLFGRGRQDRRRRVQGSYYMPLNSSYI